MQAPSAKFSVGQIVHHRKFDYRGVVVDVDPQFLGTEDWYARMARSRPPRDRPWYHVLVDNAVHNTYVAERHLAADASAAPVNHPLLEEYFVRLVDGSYVLRQRSN